MDQASKNCYVEGYLNHEPFNPKLQPRTFHPQVVEKSGVEESMVEKSSRVEKFIVKKSGLEAWGQVQLLLSLFQLVQLQIAVFIGGACLFTFHFLESNWIEESC